MRRIPWMPLIAVLLTVVLFRGATALPLGLPGEWTWERIDWNAVNRTEALWGFCLAAIVGAIYVAFTGWGDERLRRAEAANRSLARTPFFVLCGLFAIANGWVLALQQAPPEPYNLVKATWVTYYPSTSGYFYHARYRIDDVPSFLSGYEAWMREGDVLHVGTHPPGLYLLNWGMLRVCASSNTLTDVLTATMPNDIRRGLDELNRRLRGTSQGLSAADNAAIWGMILLTQWLALATIFPLYGLVRRHYSHATAWQTVSLWPLLPALNVFLPKSDAIYPFVTLLLVWCALTAVRRRSWFWGACTGAVLWMGLTMSLALLPGLVLTALLIAWEIFVAPCTDSANDTSSRNVVVAPLAAMAATFVLLIAALWWFFDLNLLTCWRLNLANHAGFYDQYPRTYWKWLLLNPLELSLSIGLPVALAVASFYARARLNFGRLPLAAWGPLIGCPVVWALLWLSGKNMGEAARLWIFLLPWGLWILAASFHLRGSDRDGRREFLWLAIAQMVAAIVTVTGVSGFHFQQF